MCEIAVDEYKQHLRRLALHDDALLKAIAAEGSSFPASVIDAKSAALARVAATIAVDAALASFQSAVHRAHRRRTNDEIVADLESVTPVTGAARVVQCTRSCTRARLRRRRRARTSRPMTFSPTPPAPRYTEPRYRFDANAALLLSGDRSGQYDRGAQRSDCRVAWRPRARI